MLQKKWYVQGGKTQVSLKYGRIETANRLKTVIISGTAGSGKSLLASKMYEYYTKNGAFAAVLNLDPGVQGMPYTCDIDIRDHVNITSIMQQYDLGPNGALVMASDLVASKIDLIQDSIDRVNPDYLIVDTPGQIELLAYRASGRLIIDGISSEEKANIFLFDGGLITTAINFASIAFLAASVSLRMNIPTINAVTKTDLIGSRINDILRWSENSDFLEDEIGQETDGDTYSLATSILRGLDVSGLGQGVVPISNVTGEGMVALGGILSRILNLGEEVED